MSLPGQPMALPLIIPGEEATAIIEQVTYERMKQIRPGFQAAYPDGLFPGQKKLPARQRLLRYLAVTEPTDYPYLEDKDYVKKFRAGVLPALKSPYWLNLVAIPDLFNEAVKDFSRLSRNAMNGEEE